MNLIHQKLIFYNLKLIETKLEMEKNKFLNKAQFNKAVLAYRKQQEILKKVNKLRDKITIYFHKLDNTKEGIQEKEQIRDFIIVINPFDQLFISKIERSLIQSKIELKYSREYTSSSDNKVENIISIIDFKLN